jgi:hypothetical protein
MTVAEPPQQAAWHDERSRIGSLMPEQVKVKEHLNETTSSSAGIPHARCGRS